MKQQIDDNRHDTHDEYDASDAAARFRGFVHLCHSHSKSSMEMYDLGEAKPGMGSNDNDDIDNDCRDGKPRIEDSS